MLVCDIVGLIVSFIMAMPLTFSGYSVVNPNSTPFPQLYIAVIDGIGAFAYVTTILFATLLTLNRFCIFVAPSVDRFLFRRPYIFIPISIVWGYIGFTMTIWFIYMVATLMKNSGIQIGGDAVGKTCLVQRFTQGAFPKPLPSGTLGAGFTNKTVKVDSDEIKLQIWDTPGQERYRPMSRNVYRSAHAIVLLYDITHQSSFDCLPEWVGEIEQHAEGKVLKVLVGTKVDQKDERIIPKSVGQKFADSNGFDYFVEISALDGTNVDALFQEVATRLRNEMKFCGDK
ncbi:ras family domain-containing protein [Ditylenchus destructor]|nr:ras family domain-containing protein [Ditylenchus destructor]